MSIAALQSPASPRTGASTATSFLRSLGALAFSPRATRQASTALAQRHAELEAQVAALHRVQAVIEFDLEGTILQANDNFLQTLGYTLEEIRGRHHSMFVDPEHVRSSAYREFWARLGRGEFDAGQYRRVGKGGREIWIQASYNPVFDSSGRPVKVVKFATDITAQQMQAADFAGQLAAINTSQAVIEFSLDGCILSANDNFLATTGYALEEVRGQHHSMFAEPEYARSAEYRQFWQKLGRGEYDAGQYRRLGKGGREIWIQASYNPIFDMNGRPFKVVKYATDISAQVRDAQALAAAVAQTREVVAAAQAGDLGRRIDAGDKTGAIAELCEGINAMVETMGSVIGQIRVAADAVALGASEIATGNADLSQRTEQQAASLEETAVSLQGLTGTVRQSAEDARQASQLAGGAVDVAAQGGRVVSEVVTTMSLINASSRRIVDIISVIDGIAFAPAAIAAGISAPQADLLASAFAAGYDPTKLSGYLGDTQERGFREGAVGRALAGDFGGGNAYLMGVANGPVELASVQGQNLINNRLLEGGGGISTTEQGRAGIAADAARAAASYASANSSNASAARTRQGMALDRADVLGGGGGRPSSKAPSGYRWNAAGGLEFIPGGPADPANKSGGAPSEDERKAAGWLGQANRALANMQDAMTVKKSDGTPMRDAKGNPIFNDADTPGFFEKYSPSEELANRSMSPERQRYSNASSSLSEALLRAATGAGVNESEARQKVAELTPQRGDSEAVKRQKMAGAAGYIEDLRARAGRALPANPTGGSAAAAFGGAAPMQVGGGVRPTTGQAPAIGTTRGGYRYTGGDPADRSSWERL
ncbi:methyl-accepting chemotaxis protein [Stenotrophomonas sp. SORGH_AS_0282]|uniref:methyl-accepting chemotaxis protein n=1 Tax=Stenotrophomonas sp. SORGH_AS_0282 TaxID=3041763 RepID=UPI002785312E|nr:methyl-accepting chemotaxis protein [Stenotrophomonas sp. SORGH_AS_0282]MDQ1062368.1 PAS domain S-box-containing protein [Stenotrophomonas sp. SORGH_AS_0282]MDQ1189275.1 PAS domain S-box-containing protein [Stenotrophomonas sp. SORGH_AS_0282]